jgi:diguanylate cyclase (GGDEF)-like protein
MNESRGIYIWLRASLQPATLFGIIMIAACWIAVTFVMSIDRRKTLDGASQQADSLVRLFEENADQTLLGIDRTLLLLRQGYEGDPEHFDLRNWAERTALIGARTVQITIAGPDGFIRATTTDYKGPPLYLGDREHFLVHAAADTNTLFISKPMIGRASGKQTIQLSRRIRGPDGRFGGMIVASLNPDFIQQFYETVDIGAHGNIMLRNLDGVILAARGAEHLTVGTKILSPFLRDALAGAPIGHFWGEGATDSVRRLIGYRVSKTFPLMTTVSYAESDVFGNYRKNRNNYLFAATFITLLVLLAIAGCTLYKTRLDRFRDNLRLSEAQAQRKSRELEVTLDTMGQGIIMTDADDKILVANRRAITLLGLPEAAGNDRTMTDGLLSSALKPDPTGCADELSDPEAPESVAPGATEPGIHVYQHTQPNGTVLEIRDAPLQEGGTVRTITDITERRRAEQQILRIAQHDTLTELANRGLLHQRIERAFARVRRSQERFAILYLDLDRFKVANDTLGHQAGDVLLRQAADRLRRCAREVDTVARVGGDEFVVLLANIATPADVSTLAARILQAMGEPYDINGNPVVVGTSIGIALAPADGASVDELLDHADLALYRAKSNGRNNFCFFDVKMSQNVIERGKLEQELRDALVRGEFELWYQPWVNIISGKIVGCEALLRWRHPVRGLMNPMEFIPTAEEAGLIGRLGDWVLRRACRDAVSWPWRIKLAVNLSAAQFVGGNLPDIVLSALKESGLDAKRLELEITETLIISDYERPREALRELRGHGITIALDDFGTGYSSLTHLRQLLINRIKIDKSFVAEMTTRTDCAAIVSAVIALGNALDVGITAEGVETHDQLVVLKAAGCTEAQGYLFSRPRPAAEILKALLDDRATHVVAA